MRKVFVIDDNEDTAESIKMLLQLERFEVKTFGAYGPALDELVDDKPCVALCDLRVPCPVGVERFISIARAAVPDMKFVLVTGDAVRAKEWLRFGADGALVKPFEPQEMINHVVEICRRSGA